MDDPQAPNSNDAPHTGAGIRLTPEHEQQLDAVFEKFEQVSAAGGDAEALVRSVVGHVHMAAASAYLLGLRTAKIRSAARSKGFNLGI